MKPTNVKMPQIGEERVQRYHGHVKMVNPTLKTIDAVVSTINPDRSDEIILPSAFKKRLDIYRRNPVFLWSHDPGKLRNYLGRAANVDVLPKQGLGALFDCSKAVLIHEDARIAFELIEAEIISSFSVGFFPVKWIIVGDPKDLPAEVLEELGDTDLTDVWIIYTEVELVEISACGIPCNRESMVVGRSVFDQVLSKAHTELAGTPEALEQFIAALYQAYCQREADKQEGNVGAEVGKEAVVKRHPIAADIQARLQAAGTTIAGYWDQDDPPDPEVCAGVISILQDVIEDVTELAASGASSASADTHRCKLQHADETKSGATFSAKNADRIKKCMGKAAETVKHCKDMLDEAGITYDDPYDLPPNNDDDEQEGDGDGDEPDDGEKTLVLTF